mmetsp:Transcript_6990/g.15983  ORF Transcript_6990/g.15983 Transcript_6990/m.15983 type:complete len:198 (+) Transcript_6990:174-767(+)
MPIAIAARNQNQFDLLEIQRCPSPELETSVPKKPERKTVTFYERVAVHVVTHYSDIEEEEDISQIWYKKSDFRNMRRDFAGTVHKISEGCYHGDSENECARGLEYRTKHGAQWRSINKRRARHAVLDEQSRQKSLGINDPDALKAVYMVQCNQSKSAAQKLGDSDSQVAKILAMQSATQGALQRSKRNNRRGLMLLR